MKKKVLAVAIAAAIPAVGSAAVINAGTNSYSNEALLVAEYLLNANVTWTAEQALGVGEEVVFTFSHAPVRSESGLAFDFPSSVQCLDAEGANSGVLALTNQTETSVTFDVSTLVSVGDVCGIATGIDIATSGVADDTDVTVTSVSNNAAGISKGDNGVDAEGNAARLFTAAGDQYSIAFAGLGATVNVEAAVPQQELLADAEVALDTALAGIFTGAISVDAEASAATQTAALGALSLTLSGGDFGWLDGDAETAGIQLAGGSSATLAGASFAAEAADVTNIDDGELSFSFASNDGENGVQDGDSFTVTLTGAGGITIAEQDISVAFVGLADAEAPAPTLLTGSGTDSYTSNGSTVSVYAVPVTNAVQNFIYLNNTSAATGEVSVTVYDEGNVYGPYSIGTVEANSTFDVGARFKEPVALDGNQLSGSRVRLDVITELPERNVAISAAYKVISANDRVNLLTSNESEHDN